MGRQNEVNTMLLELDQKERETLRRALEVLEVELEGEKAKTDSREWRAALRDEEDSVRRLLKKVV